MRLEENVTNGSHPQKLKPDHSCFAAVLIRLQQQGKSEDVERHVAELSPNVPQEKTLNQDPDHHVHTAVSGYAHEDPEEKHPEAALPGTHQRAEDGVPGDVLCPLFPSHHLEQRHHGAVHQMLICVPLTLK